MRLSLNWLKEYVEIKMPPAELGHLLTMTGLEVEGIEPIGQSLDNIVVAKILSVKPHPNADRLSLCLVDAGNGEVPVVCGAPNVKEGLFVPIARPGTRLPNGMVIKESRLRGELSSGMLLAEDEMGLTDDHTGIMILDDAEPGAPLSSVIPIEDHIFDISLTPNRPDCTSIIGIAREVAALTGQKIRMPGIKFEESNTPIEDYISITIDDPDGCPRYSAGMVKEINIKTSPYWMRYRLHASGVRSINNIVDITNYVLMEMGQPLHAFDHKLLSGQQIIVKRATEGEKFSTLDEQAHILSNEHLMICDNERSVALAGIMGGLNSEISDTSCDVLVESAYFDPVTIRRGSKSLGISTEASYRFERGIDIEGVATALKRSLMLISELAGGQVLKGIIDNYPKPYQSPLIELRIEKTNSFLGTDISKTAVSGYLNALEMEIQDLDEDTIRVKPPTYRVDLIREVDLMEEVARMEGYDNIPVTLPYIRPAEDIDNPETNLHESVSDILAGMGFSEIINYSFISPESVDFLEAKQESPLRSFVELRNPLTVDQSVMRTSLVPGLLTTLKYNVTHGETDLKLFEWGKTFTKNGQGELPNEKPVLSSIMAGCYDKKEWHNTSRNIDFYDIKGTAEVLFKSLGLKNISYRRTELESLYDPDVSCGIFVSNTLLGSIGQVSSKVVENYDIKLDSVFIMEIDLEALLEATGENIINFESFTRYPAVLRDLSIEVDKGIESTVIRDIIESNGKNLVESVNIFDLYEGDKLEESKKAISFRICFRSGKGTLDGKEVNDLYDAIIKKIRKETGGKLREG